MKSSRNGSQGLLARCGSVLSELTATQVTALLGLLWLLAYTFTGWAREASLSLVWRLELWVADLLGLTLRSSFAASGQNDWLLWAAILVAYCLASYWLIGRTRRPVPSEEDLLRAEGLDESRSGLGRGGR